MADGPAEGTREYRGCKYIDGRSEIEIAYQIAALALGKPCDESRSKRLDDLAHDLLAQPRVHRLPHHRANEPLVFGNRMIEGMRHAHQVAPQIEIFQIDLIERLDVSAHHLARSGGQQLLLRFELPE